MEDEDEDVELEDEGWCCIIFFVSWLWVGKVWPAVYEILFFGCG